MMETDKRALAIRKAIADRHAQSDAERKMIYAAARVALCRNASNGTAAMASLDSTIGAIEASFATGRKSSAIAALGRGKWGRYLPMLAIALLLGIIASIVIMAKPTSVPANDKALAALQRQYQSALPLIPVAIDFLNKISDAIIMMQKTDRAGLEAKAGKTFVTLQKLDPNLAKQTPNSLPKGTIIIVRADRFNFKILSNWTLCGAVQITKPEMVDPVRAPSKALGCPFFGLWTPGAVNW